MQNRMLRAVAAIAVAGPVAACAPGNSTPVAVKGPAPAIAETTAPIAAAAPVESKAWHIKDRHIIVGPGRSVSRIAVAYDVSERAIIEANHLRPPYRIKTGQDLVIPGSSEMPPAPVAVASPPPMVPVDNPPAPVTQAATPPPPAAAASSPPSQPSATADAQAAAAGKPLEATATARDRNPPVNAEPLPAPAAATPIPAPIATPVPMATDKPVTPASTMPTAASVTPSPAPAVVPAMAPAGVTCPPGTVGTSSMDVTKTPVFICHRIASPE